MWQTFGAPNEWNHQPITTSRNLAGIPMPEPARLFTDLQGLTTITQEGNARVNGVDTTHYKGVETYASPTGHETKTVDLWISSDNLVRRLTSVTKLTLDTPGSTGGSTTVETSETLDAQFSQFGIPTNIQPPPANEVVGSASTPSG